MKLRTAVTLIILMGWGMLIVGYYVGSPRNDGYLRRVFGPDYQHNSKALTTNVVDSTSGRLVLQDRGIWIEEIGRHDSVLYINGPDGTLIRKIELGIDGAPFRQTLYDADRFTVVQQLNKDARWTTEVISPKSSGHLSPAGQKNLN